MESTSRRFQRIEPKPEMEVKGIVVVLFCYVYAILLFFLGAMLVQLTGSTKQHIMAKIRCYQFWNVQREKKLELLIQEKYDINHNEIKKKIMYIGQR